MIELGALVVENGALGEIYGVELDVMLEGDTMERCNVTVTEDGAVFEFGVPDEVVDPTEIPGNCVMAPKSTTAERPCQLSNFTTEGGEVVFDLECRPNPILNIAAQGFNVGAVGSGSGPTTIRFSNCSGF